MADNGNKLILGPNGRPIIQQVGLVVLKVPVGAPALDKRLIVAIAQTTHCNVIVIPSEYDLLTGRLAYETLQSIHSMIHEIEKNTKAPGAAPPSEN